MSYNEKNIFNTKANFSRTLKITKKNKKNHQYTFLYNVVNNCYLHFLLKQEILIIKKTEQTKIIF